MATRNSDSEPSPSGDKWTHELCAVVSVKYRIDRKVNPESDVKSNEDTDSEASVISTDNESDSSSESATDENAGPALRYVSDKKLGQRQCPECKEWFAKNGIARHLKFVHNRRDSETGDSDGGPVLKLHKCSRPGCGKAYNRGDNLRKHIREKHAFVCKFGGCGFTTGNRTHIKDHHEDHEKRSACFKLADANETIAMLLRQVEERDARIDTLETEIVLLRATCNEKYNSTQ